MKMEPLDFGNAVIDYGTNNIAEITNGFIVYLLL